MPRFLVLLLYNLLQPLMLLAMAPKAWKKMKARGGKASDLWQRFGFFSPETLQQLRMLREGSSQLFWIHAVSVGEVGIAVKLVRELRKRNADLAVVITTTTPTGHAQVQKFAQQSGGRVFTLYSALDGWFTVRRFLKAIRPTRLVLVEAEVWPNLVHACHRRGIPVSLVNARLSPRSERRFRRFRFLVEPIYSLLSQAGVQEAEDPARFSSALGIQPSRLVTTGSIKFDLKGEKEPVEQVAAFRALLASAGHPPEHPVLLGASTHPGEEKALGEVCQRLRGTFPTLYLIVVPRHAERGGEVLRELQALGLEPRLRSSLANEPHQGAGNALVVDSTGELRAWQYLATVVVVGKSFLGIGGQNPAEAVVAGRPVVFGPHMENFTALKDLLLTHEGAAKVGDFAALENLLPELLRASESRDRMALAGLKALQPHEGATARTADMLLH